MADESKAPQSPESKNPEAPGAASAPPTATPNAVAPASAAVKPPVPKPPVVLQTPLDNDLTKRYRERFNVAILEAIEDRKQPYLVIGSAQLADIARYSRDIERFDLLEDYTAVDWPRREKRFDLTQFCIPFRTICVCD